MLLRLEQGEDCLIPTEQGIGTLSPSKALLPPSIWKVLYPKNHSENSHITRAHALESFV